MKVTKDELTNLVSWNDIGVGTCYLYMKLFEREVLFTFFSSDILCPEISENMFETVMDAISIENDSLSLVKDLLWEECIFAFQVADYGCVPEEGETHLQAHLREFELADKEDAYRGSELMGVRIHQVYDDLVGRYAEIDINSASNNLISVIIKNGEIIDFDDNGTYVAQFEDESTFARVKRSQVLNKI